MLILAWMFIYICPQPLQHGRSAAASQASGRATLRRGRGAGRSQLYFYSAGALCAQVLFRRQASLYRYCVGESLKCYNLLFNKYYSYGPTELSFDYMFQFRFMDNLYIICNTFRYYTLGSVLVSIDFHQSQGSHYRPR